MAWKRIDDGAKDGRAVLLGYFRRNLDGSVYPQGGEPVVARWNPPRMRPKEGEEADWLGRAGRLKSTGPFSPTHYHELPHEDPSPEDCDL